MSVRPSGNVTMTRSPGFHAAGIEDEPVRVVNLAFRQVIAQEYGRPGNLIDGHIQIAVVVKIRHRAAPAQQRPQLFEPDLSRPLQKVTGARVLVPPIGRAVAVEAHQFWVCGEVGHRHAAVDDEQIGVRVVVEIQSDGSPSR